jgi:hypothetical protein
MKIANTFAELEVFPQEALAKIKEAPFWGDSDYEPFSTNLGGTFYLLEAQGELNFVYAHLAINDLSEPVWDFIDRLGDWVVLTLIRNSLGGDVFVIPGNYPETINFKNSQ